MLFLFEEISKIIFPSVYSEKNGNFFYVKLYKNIIKKYTS